MQQRERVSLRPFGQRQGIEARERGASDPVRYALLAKERRVQTWDMTLESDSVGHRLRRERLLSRCHTYHYDPPPLMLLLYLYLYLYL